VLVNGGATIKSMSAAFMADVERAWLKHGPKVLDVLAEKYSQAFFGGMVAMTKVIRWETGADAASFSRTLTPDQIMDKLEERVGPEGRKLFEKFIQVNVLQAKQQLEAQAQMGVAALGRIGRLHVRRAKGGDASVHPISARESRALRKLLREAPTSPLVFILERRAPLSAAGHQRMVARAGVAAKFTFLFHSHMLRHACGFKLANDGHDTHAIQAYLGHRSIMSTVRYTALTPNRFIGRSSTARQPSC
jgi:hypothetical protein